MDKNDFGKLLKQRRIMADLTLQELAAKSGVSASHMGRIERGQRFPSAHILRKIANPLGFEETELFTLADYLSPLSPVAEGATGGNVGRLDPYVASVLAQEPVETQRTMIGILSILKSLARAREPEA